MNGKDIVFSDNEENSIEFLKMCEAEGILTSFGRKPSDLDYHYCYSLGYVNSDNTLTHSESVRGRKVIDLKELKKRMNTFTKDDLKPMMLVKRRNGKFAIIDHNVTKTISENGYLNIRQYSDSLEFQGAGRSTYDIVEVYQPTKVEFICDMLNPKMYDLVWKRKEKTSMTIKGEHFEFTEMELKYLLNDIKSTLEVYDENL